MDWIFSRKSAVQRERKFRVFTTVNPCGMDVQNWDELKIPTDYAEKQLKINECYERLGMANFIHMRSIPVIQGPERGLSHRVGRIFSCGLRQFCFRADDE